jgi:2-polyprenyl-3-methyl-5-hydroxy-6-metoxy-1,4-benzoquinol methylase
MNSELTPKVCPITGELSARRVFVYDRAPEGETEFEFSGEEYYREVWQFQPTGHYVSVHKMGDALDYTDDYVSSTYSDGEGIHRAFQRVQDLPTEKSDNFGRVTYLRDAVSQYGLSPEALSVLDVGSGTGVFPFSITKLGWRCLAIDPDLRAVEHMETRLGLDALCGQFDSGLEIGQFDLLTLNKVLEHVVDPVGMLSLVHEYTRPAGLVYLEVPDGESAELAGQGREEFFIDHHHVFSARSIEYLATQVGLECLAIERLTEPSSKFTLRALCRVPEQSI